MKHNAIDLFAGCGGLSQGLAKAGFMVLAAIEKDSLAARTYIQNHRKTIVYNQDIRDFAPQKILSDFKLQTGDLDLLAACPPCQGFSRLRYNNKACRLNDPRNQLIDEIRKFVEVLLPKVVMIENVPGLERYSRFKSLVTFLRRLEFNVTWTTVNIDDFGVPQRRRRLVLLASRLGEIQILVPPSKKKTVRDAISITSHPHFNNDPLHNMKRNHSEKTNKIISLIPLDGGSRKDLPKDLTSHCHLECDGFYDVYGRMKWDDVAPTITSGCINPSKGRFLHPSENRTISLREAALLQTFPKNYFFCLSDGLYAVAALIGNAFPPEYAKLQGRTIINHLENYSDKD